MNRVFGLFVCCALLHVATSNTINLRSEDDFLDQMNVQSDDQNQVDTFSTAEEEQGEQGEQGEQREQEEQVNSYDASDFKVDNLTETAAAATVEGPQEVAEFNNTNENYPINNEVTQQVRQYTKEQLQYQFAILKACTQSPAAFSTQFISHMQHVFRLFANELRSAFVNEVQLAFQAAMSDPGKVMTQEAMDEYYVILDTVKNWDISRRNMVRIFDRVAAYSRNEISQAELQQAIMEVIKDEILEDEQAFQQGDISAFIKNAVIVDDYEQPDYNTLSKPAE